MKIKLLLLVSFIAIQIGCNAPYTNRKFPIILQEKPKQCGPVCLQMICKFYGKDIELKKIEEFSGMDHSGTSLLGLSEAADSIGLKNLGIQLTFDILSKEAPLPAIVHWNNNHFVIVYKTRNNKVWVADPALGKMEYTNKEFLEGWLKTDTDTSGEGVALILEPKPEFFKN